MYPLSDNVEPWLREYGIPPLSGSAHANKMSLNTFNPPDHWIAPPAETGTSYLGVSQLVADRRPAPPRKRGTAVANP